MGGQSIMERFWRQNQESAAHDRAVSLDHNDQHQIERLVENGVSQAIAQASKDNPAQPISVVLIQNLHVHVNYASGGGATVVVGGNINGRR